jgi:hypothetical protein
MMRTLGLLVSCLLAGQVAQAQESGVDPRVGDAKTACAAGDVQKGVRLLAELYTATNDPIWIFNQGRCYHQNSQLPQALARFKEFLRKSKGTPDEDVKDAQNWAATARLSAGSGSLACAGTLGSVGGETGAGGGAISGRMGWTAAAALFSGRWPAGPGAAGRFHSFNPTPNASAARARAPTPTKTIRRTPRLAGASWPAERT